MKYNVKAIETEYRNCKFRSRLEATWAAFFDLNGLNWEYEPFDLDGWFPDFRIYQGRHKGDMLVEVKPTYFDSHKDLIDLKNEIRKGYPGEVLILGNAPHTNAYTQNEKSSFGLLLNDLSEDSSYGGKEYYDLAMINETDTGRVDISAWNGSFQFRFSLEYDGDHHLCPMERTMIDARWSIAKNTTQYKNKRWKR